MSQSKEGLGHAQLILMFALQRARPRGLAGSCAETFFKRFLETLLLGGEWVVSCSPQAEIFEDLGT